MEFAFYKNNGTIGITNTKIEDILAEVQPEDIVDNLDSVGVIINNYFASIADGVQYILWIDRRGNISLKKYAQSIANGDTLEEDAEDFKISNQEKELLIAFINE